MSWNCEIFSTFVWFYGTRRVATVPPASEVSSVGHGAGWRYLYRRRACHTHGTFRTYAFQNLWGACDIHNHLWSLFASWLLCPLFHAGEKRRECHKNGTVLRAIGSVLEHSTAHVFQLAFDCWYQYGTRRSMATVNAISAVTAVELEIGFVVVNGARDSMKEMSALERPVYLSTALCFLYCWNITRHRQERKRDLY